MIPLFSTSSVSYLQVPLHPSRLFTHSVDQVAAASSTARHDTNDFSCHFSLSPCMYNDSFLFFTPAQYYLQVPSRPSRYEIERSVQDRSTQDEDYKSRRLQPVQTGRRERYKPKVVQSGAKETRPLHFRLLPLAGFRRLKLIVL